MKVNTEEEMTDLRTVVGIHGDYATCEPFLEGAYDLRIQKIGQRIRAFKRTGTLSEVFSLLNLAQACLGRLIWTLLPSRR